VSRRYRFALACLTLSVSAAVAPIPGAVAADDPPVDVRITGTGFGPKDVSIQDGGTVIWHADAGTHQVVADGDHPAFDSGILGEGTTFTKTFEKSDRFPYHCEIHQDMTGTIYVGEPVPTSSTTTTSAPPPTTTTSPPVTATTEPPTTTTTARPTTTTKPVTPTTAKPKAAGAGTTGTTAKRPDPAAEAAKAAEKAAKEAEKAARAAEKQAKAEADATSTTVTESTLPPLTNELRALPAITQTTGSTSTTIGVLGNAAAASSTRSGGRSNAQSQAAMLGAFAVLVLLLIGGGVAWWRQRPGKYWAA
jgi:plastocyanin